MAAIVSCPNLVARAPLGLRPSRPSRPAARHHPSVAVRRRRAAVLVAFAALGLLLGVGSLAGAGRDPAQLSGGRAEVRAVPVVAAGHVVQLGDTLWTIARRLQPDGDVRPLVARLQAQRGGGPLVPGERIPLAV